MRAELHRRIDAIEAAYEFLLAYAAQGLSTDQGAKSGSELREQLASFAGAVDGLAEVFRGLAAEEEGGDVLLGYLDVLERDQRSTLSALELVRSRPALSSQLIDNLNASIHVRALLTDLFLLDELLELGVALPAEGELPAS